MRYWHRWIPFRSGKGCLLYTSSAAIAFSLSVCSVSFSMTKPLAAKALMLSLIHIFQLIDLGADIVVYSAAHPRLIQKNITARKDGCAAAVFP